MDPAILLIGVRDGVSGPADALGLRNCAFPHWPARRRGPAQLGAGDLPADLRARVLREVAGNPLALSGA